VFAAGACASVPVRDGLRPETRAALPAALIEAAGTYVQALISRDWESAHKLLTPTAGDDLSLSSFRVRMSGTYEAATIRVFEIQEINFAPEPPSASIWGCAALRGRREPTVMVFDGGLFMGRWLFNLPERTGQLGEREMTCSFARKAKALQPSHRR
jgi:hypothetical protein